MLDIDLVVGRIDDAQRTLLLAVDNLIGALTLGYGVILLDLTDDTAHAHVQLQFALGLGLDYRRHEGLFLGEGVMEDHLGVGLSRDFT